MVAWSGPNGSDADVFGARFQSSGIPAGPAFRVNTYTTGAQAFARIASDPAGNFVVAWLSDDQDGVDGVFAQRYAGGLSSAALAVDGAAGPTSDGNGVFEAGETVAVAPSWLNANFGAETFTGTASPLHRARRARRSDLHDRRRRRRATGLWRAARRRAVPTAADCYALGITCPDARDRPQHWDATFREEIAPANLGAAKNWSLHVGDSFADVPRASGFYRFVETLLHRGITGGCSATQYCPSATTTREQMAVFVLVAKDGAGNVPPACATPMFNDVPASSPFCPWIEELARRGVVGGCGGGNYCPPRPSAASRWRSSCSRTQGARRRRRPRAGRRCSTTCRRRARSAAGSRSWPGAASWPAAAAATTARRRQSPASRWPSSSPPRSACSSTGLDAHDHPRRRRAPRFRIVRARADPLGH